jgi:uncharacterized protein
MLISCSIRYALGVVAVSILAVVHTASFDYHGSRQPREKAICFDPALSELDGRLGAEYLKRFRSLSPDGQALIRMSQRSWLHFVGIVCPVDPSPGSQDPLPEDSNARALVLERRDPVKCLTGAYKDRLEQVGQVGQRMGP